MGDDAALVAGCLRGERCAYDDLVRKHQAAAFGLAISFAPWLRAILVNGAKQRFRSRRERLSLEAVSAELGQRAVDDFVRQSSRQKLRS